MTALERIDKSKLQKPLCIDCCHAVELETTLACGHSGKLILPQYPPFKCKFYQNQNSNDNNSAKDCQYDDKGGEI